MRGTVAKRLRREAKEWVRQFQGVESDQKRIYKKLKRAHTRGQNVQPEQLF